VKRQCAVCHNAPVPTVNCNRQGLPEVPKAPMEETSSQVTRAQLCLKDSIDGDETLEASLQLELESVSRSWEALNVISVDLSSNNLTSEAVGESQILGSLGNSLEELDLSDNDLEYVPKVVITKLRRLKKLNLSENRLEDVVGFIKCLRQLQELNVSGNALSSLPAELALLLNLTKLEAMRNCLGSLPPDLKSLPVIREMHLSGNNLGPKIPAVLFEMTSLVSLALSSNHIQMIDDAIGDLINLESLTIMDNEIEKVPVALCRCTKLKRINLSQNLVCCLPDEFVAMEHLEELFLDSNRLENLPEELGKLSTLKRLSVENNPKLTALPPGLGHLDEIMFSGAVEESGYSHLSGVRQGLPRNAVEVEIHKRRLYPGEKPPET